MLSDSSIHAELADLQCLRRERPNDPFVGGAVVALAWAIGEMLSRPAETPSRS